MIPTAISLISDERFRQQNEKGFTRLHDAKHDDGELTEAALCYAVVGGAQIRGSSKEEWPVEMFDGLNDSLVDWPFEDHEYKPEDNAIANLTKAAALLAAEIDRLLLATQV